MCSIERVAYWICPFKCERVSFLRPNRHGPVEAENLI